MELHYHITKMINNTLYSARSREDEQKKMNKKKSAPKEDRIVCCDTEIRRWRLESPLHCYRLDEHNLFIFFSLLFPLIRVGLFKH